jgi:hypothetical protein
MLKVLYFDSGDEDWWSYLLTQVRVVHSSDRYPQLALLSARLISLCVYAQSCVFDCSVDKH